MGPVPIERGTKHPPEGFPLKRYFGRLATGDELRCWFATEKYELALVMGSVSGVIGIDVDSEEKAQALSKKLPKTEMMTKTPRGRHFIYQIARDQIVPNRVGANVLGVEADMRGEHSILLASPSIHPIGGHYERVGRWELVDVPYYDSAWITETVTAPRFEASEGAVSGNRWCSQVNDLEAYCARVPSIQGQNGSKGCFRVACLCRDQGFTQEQAFQFMQEWQALSPLVEPKWSEKELWHKIDDAYCRSELLKREKGVKI